MLPDEPQNLYVNGSEYINPSTVVLGANTRDGVTPWYPAQIPPVESNQSVYEQYMYNHFCENANYSWYDFSENATNAIIAQYPLDRFNGDAASAFVEADADYAVGESVLRNERNKEQAINSREASSL